MIESIGREHQKWVQGRPKDWKVKRYKEVFAERNDRSETGEELLLSVSAYTGITPRSNLVDEGDLLSRADSLVDYKKCCPNDLVMNIMLAWNKGLAFTDIEGIVSPAYAVFKVISNDEPRFLNYLVRDDEVNLYFKSYSTGIIDSRLRLYPEVFGRLYCVLPDVDTQIRIANFLDMETMKIDRLIQKQESLIDRLKTKRYLEISSAVTFGIDKSYKFTNCSTELLEKIPKHWEFKKLKHIATIFASNVDKKTLEGQQSIKLCNYTDVYYNEIITSDIDFMEASATDEQIAKFSLKANDVIITKDSETPDDIGVAALVIEDIPGVICGYHLSIVRPKNGFSGAFIKRLFDSSYVKSSWMTLANGVTRFGLGQYAIDNLKVPVPPYDEQILIASTLDELTKKIDILIDKSKSSISLLKEHRKSLIHAAVTGKIDVRESL